MITGFPNESEDDHKLTLSLMEEVKYSFGYMFKYSERPGTLAAKKLLFMYLIYSAVVESV